MGVIPVLNKRLEQGLTLPIVDNVSFVNPVLTFGSHYLAISTSLNYTGNGQPKNNFPPSKLGRTILSRKI